MPSALRKSDVTRQAAARPQRSTVSFFTIQAMLNSVDSFDVPTRVRELEASIARRVREALQPHIREPEVLEATALEILTISRDYAGSFQAISNRARIQRERQAE